MSGDKGSNTEAGVKRSEEDKKPTEEPPQKKRQPEEEAVEQEEEDDEEEEDEEEEEKEKSLVVEGKRQKKKVMRLDFQISKSREPLSIEAGKGEKLGDIERIKYFIGKIKTHDLKPLHKLLYNRPGAEKTLKRNLRLFNGFAFEKNSDPYNKKVESLKRKNPWLTNAMLKKLCLALDLERNGKHDELIDRIMTFLLKPRTTGKPLPKSKKKKPKKGEKRGNKSRSPSKAKAKVTKKSEEIVMETSSEEDEEESKEQASGKEAVRNVQEKEDDEEEESPKPQKKGQKRGKTESISAVTAREKREAKGKKKDPSSDEVSEVSDLSSEDVSSDEEEEVSLSARTFFLSTGTKINAAKKRPAKAASVKKADSSSTKTKTTKTSKAKEESEDSSDDEPLIKIVKKPPTDEQLKVTVKKLLDNANLEEVTMKQICKKVYESYPDHDLSSRKDFIKTTVKELIS
uniref:Protein DEK n=1 Tax=Lepisosteus oculatus TaxID=7918 RepID=W5MFJ4_LEPOC